jgi:hypothetical protein
MGIANSTWLQLFTPACEGNPDTGIFVAELHGDG